MGRLLAVVACVSLVASACGSSGGGNGSEDASRTQRTDAAGNLISGNEDWSAIGQSSENAGAADAGTRGSERENDSTADTEPPCGVPTTTPEQAGAPAPPGFDPHAPLAEPENDFPMEATIRPTRGDPGDKITIDVVAVAQPGAVVAVLARFYDGHHHGLRAAKFADATGRASFAGRVPASAPIGISKITVSVSNSKEESALDVLDFIVTGPGCP